MTTGAKVWVKQTKSSSGKPAGLAASKYATDIDSTDGSKELSPEAVPGEPDSSSAALASVGEPSPTASSYAFLLYWTISHQKYPGFSLLSFTVI